MHGTPDEVAANWQRGIANATQKAQAGVDRVTTAPGAAAAAQVNKFAMAVSDPAMHQLWANRVRAVSLQSWQDAMKNKGIQRMASGAAAAQQKFASVMGPLLQHIDSQVGMVKQMPSATYEDREQRMLAFSRGMRTFKKPAGL